MLLLQQIITAGYGLIVPALIIKTYGSNVNGTVSSITQFLSYITLLEAGIGSVVTASLYKPLAQKDTGKLSGIIVATEDFFHKLALIFIFYLVIIAVGYPYFVSEQFDWFYTFTLVIIISIGTFAQYYFGITYQLLLTADQKIWLVSGIQALSTILILFVTLGCVGAKLPIHILKLLSVVVYVLRPLTLNIYVKRKYKIDRTVTADKEAISERWNGLAHHIAYIIHYNTDVIILTIFLNVLEVSVYTVYYNIVSNVYKIISSVSSGIKASVGNLIACGKMDAVNQILNEFETLNFMMVSVFYSCVAALITPFIGVYTKGVTDVNYIRPTFALLLVCAEASYCMRNPYDMIIFASGHFRQTKIGAYEEAGINIILSLLLVRNLGLIGVVIGTLTAMMFRLIQYVWYLKYNILFRSPIIFIKKFLCGVTTSATIVFSCQAIKVDIQNYPQWIIYAIGVFIYSVTIVLLVHILCLKKELIDILKRFTKK